jgi:hypothetical protein
VGWTASVHNAFLLTTLLTTDYHETTPRVRVCVRGASHSVLFFVVLTVCPWQLCTAPLVDGHILLIPTFSFGVNSIHLLRCYIDYFLYKLFYRGVEKVIKLLMSLQT